VNDFWKAFLNASSNRHVQAAFDAGEIAFAKKAVNAKIVGTPEITDCAPHHLT